jgi:hypothetical protein
MFAIVAAVVGALLSAFKPRAWEGRSDRPRSGDEILLSLAGGMRGGCSATS